jgi:hypothetical protein
VPLTYIQQYTGEHLVVASVKNGQVSVSDPALLQELTQFSADWAQNLIAQRYLRAARRTGKKKGAG